MRNSFMKKSLISLAASAVLSTSIYAAGSYSPAISTDRTKYNVNQLMNMKVVDGDSNSSSTASVTITSAGTGFSVTKTLSLASDAVTFGASTIDGGNDTNGTEFTTSSSSNADGAADANATLYVNSSDTITLAYTATDGDTGSKTITIGYDDASFSGTTSKVYTKYLNTQDNNVTVILQDNDLNLATDKNDTKKIKVTNQSGVSVNMILDETNVNTGIFKGILHVGMDTNLSNTVTAYGGTSSATTYFDSNSSKAGDAGFIYDRNTTISTASTGDILTVSYGTNVNAATIASYSNSDSEGNVSGYTMDIKADGSQTELTYPITVSAGTKGVLSLDASTYYANTPMTITLTDTDLDTSSSAVNQSDANTSGHLGSSTPDSGSVVVYVKDSSDSYDYNVSLRLIETGLNTGVFSKSISFTPKPSGAISTNVALDYNGTAIPVESGSTITVKYNDALDGTTSTTDNTISTSGTFATNTGELSLSTTAVNDKGQVVITLTDQDLNTDSTIINSHTSGGSDWNITVCNGAATTAYSSAVGTCIGALDTNLTFTETGVNTGIFTSNAFDVNVSSASTGVDTTSPDLNLSQTGYTVGTVRYTDYVDGSGSTGTFASPKATASLSGMTNVGLISFDKSSYSSGAITTITVTDTDLDTDPTTAEVYYADGTTSPQSTVKVDDSSSSAASGILVKLTETGVNTGIFTGTVTLSSSDSASSQKLSVATTATKITAVYLDNTGTAYTTSDSNSRYAQAAIVNTTGTLEVDVDSVNNQGDKFKITVTDGDRNLNPTSKDGDINVTVRSTSNTAGCTFVLSETDVNTGIFTGSLATVLTTTATDTTCSASTINVQNNDIIEIKYTDEKDSSGSSNTLTKTISTAQTLAEMTLSSSVEAGGEFTISLTEPDGGVSSSVLLATTPVAKDSFTVRVFSNSDAIGFDTTLIETDVDSKVFEGTLTADSSLSITNSKIKAVEGDTITVRYEDYTTGSATSTAVSSVTSTRVEQTITVSSPDMLATDSLTHTVAIDGSKDIVFTGANTSLTATSSDNNITTVTASADMITIKGVNEGSATITVTDGTDSVDLTVNVAGSLTVESAPLTDGWNLISNNSSKVLDTSAIGAEFTWSYANSTWTKNDTAVAPMQGFWAKTTGLTNFTFTNDEVNPEFDIASDTGSWILAGTKAETTLSTLKNTYMNAFIYNNNTKEWLNAVDNADSMVGAGAGYWLQK